MPTYILLRLELRTKNEIFVKEFKPGTKADRTQGYIIQYSYIHRAIATEFQRKVATEQKSI